jgi:hypothetical protein
MCRRNLRDLVNFPCNDVSCDGRISFGTAKASKLYIAYLSMSLRTIAGVLILKLRDWLLRGAVAARLVKPEDIAIGVRTVIEGRNEVFERCAGIVCKFLEKNLRFFFSEGAHIGEIYSSRLNLQFPRERA